MAETISINTIVFAFVGGIFPALIWLWFWLKEDKKRPEPRGLVALSFMAGVIGVIVTFPIQKIVFNFVSGLPIFGSSVTSPMWEAITPSVVITLAAVEEFIKYFAALIIALKSRFFDEPVDAVIYLITIALGFAAMENFLYLISITADQGLLQGALNANLRFIGATLLHVVSSGAVGIAIGLSFYKSRPIKMLYLFLGLLTAVVLHSIFNLIIIDAGTSRDILVVFSYFWIAVIILILLFEKVKSLKKTL